MMTAIGIKQLIQQWQAHEEPLRLLLSEAFARHAVDNHGILATTRRAPHVATEVFELFLNYLYDVTDSTGIAAVVTRLAREGMAIVTGAQMMRAVTDLSWLVADDPYLVAQMSQHLARFQTTFLENLANTREVEQRQIRESSQLSLQRALRSQLEEQRILHRTQEQHTNSLREILTLNARLAQARNEAELLEEAVSGICQSLHLADVTIYQYHAEAGQWEIRTSTRPETKPGMTISSPTLEQLNGALDEQSEVVRPYQTATGSEAISVTTLLHGASRVLGAVVANSGDLTGGLGDFPILMRTFVQNLGALWVNLTLFSETRQRSRELDILHGRYLDEVWGQDNVTLAAMVTDGQLEISRDRYVARPLESGQIIPLRVGDRATGQVTLPQLELSPDRLEFAETLIREMGNALNIAHLVQTSQTYSNQLSAAAETVRAATTILERDQLIQEIVELIRARFGLYYVGLFLVDERNKTAILQAGTGTAGRIQVENGHQHAIGGRSLIGTAIASGSAVVVQDVNQAANFSYNPLLRDTRSELALPLRTRGHTIGALTAQSSHVGAFPAQSVAVLQTLADQCAVAIENAGLFTQLQANLNETSWLYETSRLMGKASTPGEVYSYLVDYARQSGFVDVAYVIAADESDPDYLVMQNVWSRIKLADASSNRFLRRRFSSSRLLAENELIIIPDIQTAPNVDRLTKRLYQRAGLETAGLVPIHIEGEWLATVVIHCSKLHTLTKSDLQPFATLADQAAVILANQQLLRQTRALYRISRSLSQAITREDCLAIAVKEVAEYTGAGQCRFVQYEKRLGLGTVVAEYRPTGLAHNVQLPILGDYAYEYLSQRRKPLLLEESDPKIPNPIVRRHLHQFDARISLLIPAASQDELIGFMAIDSAHSKWPFVRDNIAFAQTVVDHLTTQIENIKLLDETLSSAQELVTLNQIGSSMSGTLDLDDLAKIIYDQVGRLLDNTIFILAQYDEEEHRLTPLLCVVEGQTQPLAPAVLLPEDPLRLLLESSSWEPISQPSSMPKVNLLPELDQSPNSSLWMAFHQDGVPAGLISVQSFETHAYDDNDVQLLRSIATQAGLAINNADLFAESQRNVAELRLLFRVTQAAASSIDPGERLHNVAQRLHEALSKADIAILLVDYEEQRFEMIASQGVKRPARTLSLSEGLPGLAMAKGQPLIVNKRSELATYLPQDTHVQSQLAVPLKLGWRIVGLVVADSEHENAFDDGHLRLLQTLSVVLAATLESGRLFKEIQEANEQLRQLDSLKTQFLANMSHELRTPLNSIIGFSRVILKGIDGPITAEQEEDLITIYNNGQHLLMLINEILDMAKIEAGKMSLGIENVDVSEAANIALNTIRGIVAENDVELTWSIPEKLPLIEADPIRLRQILINLLSNAAKYTDEGSIDLTIRDENGERIHFIISDTGVGIAQSDFDKLFEAFEQVDSSPTRTVGGTGLGLPITKWLVNMHYGEIWLESEVGKGTTFHVALPVNQQTHGSQEVNLDQTPAD